jgi:hypothetical protein
MHQFPPQCSPLLVAVLSFVPLTERGSDRAGLSKAASRTARLDVTSHRDNDQKKGGRCDAGITDEWGRRRPAYQLDRRRLPRSNRIMIIDGKDCSRCLTFEFDEHERMLPTDRVSLGEFLGVNGWGRPRSLRVLAIDARVLGRLRCLPDEFVFSVSMQPLVSRLRDVDEGGRSRVP